MAASTTGRATRSTMRAATPGCAISDLVAIRILAQSPERVIFRRGLYTSAQDLERNYNFWKELRQFRAIFHRLPFPVCVLRGIIKVVRCQWNFPDIAGLERRFRASCHEASWLAFPSPISPQRWSSGFSLRPCGVKSSIATVCVWASNTTTVKFPRLKPELQRWERLQKKEALADAGSVGHGTG